MLSKSCEYAIKATLFISNASKENKRISLREISNAIDSPLAFTAKILQQLVKNGLISSLKGRSGGFFIPDKYSGKIMLSQIVMAFDGDQLFKGCVIGLDECNEQKPCPIHHEYKAIRDEMFRMMSCTSIEDLSTGLTEGLTFLRR